MAEYFAGGHLRFIDGEWRDNNGDVVDIREVKHGAWIEKFKDGFWYYDCPFCDDGYVVMERDENKPRFCHNCGAKMNTQ